MQGKDFDIQVTHTHRVRFSRDVFDISNKTLADLLKTKNKTKVLTFIDQGVANFFPELEEKLSNYIQQLKNFTSKGLIIQTGGEPCKQNQNTLQEAWDAIEKAGIDRHSYVFCIGGGAYLDVIGFAAATAHRGIRFVRFPTTTLAQDDSGVGVKNGINAYGKKNFLGTFSVPYAVVNDFSFIHKQPEIERRAGIVEAIKVALVKNASFYNWIEDNCEKLFKLDEPALETTIQRSAILHAEHIAYGGDPFETGSSRPLDFGHWAAHKLEQLTNFSLSHADAVSIGISLDTVYSWKTKSLTKDSAIRILNLLKNIGLPTWHDALDLRTKNGSREVYQGLEEFREHLGGKLTVLLLQDIGKGKDVHEIDTELLDTCIILLKNTF